MRFVLGISLILAAGCYNGNGCDAASSSFQVDRQQVNSAASLKLKVPPAWNTADSVLPVSYLEELGVDPEWRLTNPEKAQLTRLIAAAHDTSVAEYKQSYYLRTETPLWKLIRSNWKGADSLVAEGAVVNLGELKDFLVSSKTPN